MTAPVRPDSFEAVISIEWSAVRAPAGVMGGWRFAPRMEDGTLILTVSRLTLHASADDVVWAEMTMFADAEGRPVYRTGEGWQPHLGEDGSFAEATFPFLVSGMTVRELPVPAAPAYPDLCRRCDVYIGYGALGVAVAPAGHAGDVNWLSSHCWVCKRSREEITSGR